jgi:hypothetical protein
MTKYRLILAKGKALVRGIFKELCFLKRRNKIAMELK